MSAGYKHVLMVFKTALLAFLEIFMKMQQKIAFNKQKLRFFDVFRGYREKPVAWYVSEESAF